MDWISLAFFFVNVFLPSPAGRLKNKLQAARVQTSVRPVPAAADQPLLKSWCGHQWSPGRTGPWPPALTRQIHRVRAFPPLPERGKVPRESRQSRKFPLPARRKENSTTGGPGLRDEGTPAFETMGRFWEEEESAALVDGMCRCASRVSHVELMNSDSLNIDRGSFVSRPRFRRGGARKPIFKPPPGERRQPASGLVLSCVDIVLSLGHFLYISEDPTSFLSRGHREY